MSLTLLVENNPKIESFYMLNLSTWLALEVVTKKRAEFAIRYLEENPGTIKLIIARARIDKEESAKQIVEYLQKKGLSIPVVEIGPGAQIPGCFAHVPNSLQLKILIQSAARALNITAKEMSAKVVPDHFPIPILYFKVIRRSVCPVFSPDIDHPGKFLLRLEKNRDFEESTINRMVEEGVTHLYINKLDRLDFVNNVTSELMTLLESTELSPDEEISAADKSMELLSKKLLSIGVTEETIKLAHKNMSVMRKNAKMYPKMSQLLERLLANKASYLFRHTQILTYVGLHIVENIDWGTPEQEDKMSFIAFFHDIVLDSDEQGKIKSNLELKKSDLSPEQRLLVEKHAQMAAEFVSKFPHSPMGADQIIRQHHGMLNGLGFSDHFSGNLSPMVIVFIIAEEFTRIIMGREGGPFDRVQMLRELKEVFHSSRFQKVIDILQSTTF